MDSSRVREPLALLFTFLLVSSAVAAAGLAGGVTPQDRVGADALRGPAEPATDGQFASDAAAARALDSPASAAEATVTPLGGRASVVGTGTAIADAPVSIEAAQRFALAPERPGEIRVVHEYRMPDSVTSVTVQRPEDATVQRTEGFDAADAGTFEWDGDTSNPSVTYTMTVNETIELAGPEGAAGRYLFVDAGEWALFRRPEMAVSWSWRGGDSVGLQREKTTAGPGHTGDWVVYLGRTTTHTRTAHGQTLTLVVPDRASLAESPDDILDSMTTASDQLRVGDRDENVSAFATPTTTVEWGVRGLQLGDTDMWIRDVETLDRPDNTWLHEYVHSRQSFRTTATGEWVTEASATYYAALLALDQGRTDFREFREFLGRGSAPPQSAAVLEDPQSWANAANYLKGSLVTGAIDRQIRLSTDGTRSFGTVLSRFNARTDPVDGAATLETIRAVAGSSTREYARPYLTTSQVPDRWSASQHTEAFGTDPARFTYRFGPASGSTDGVSTATFVVSGPYRNVTLDRPPLALYTGETVTATGVVRNAGGASAPYEQYFTVDSRVRSTVSGTLAPDETATHEFTHTVRTPGDRTLSFGAETVTIEVYDTATASISDVNANRTVLPRPGVVGLDVTVTNGFDAPADRHVNVTLNGEMVSTTRVTLGPGEEETVSVPVRVAERGEHEIGVENADSVTVTVGQDGDRVDDSERDEGGESSDGPGGFSPVVVLLGVVAAFVVLGLLTGLALLLRWR